ncbi:type II toxin-antitoxin system RelE/ParE family toxin [Pseudorhodoferax sp. Leaf274]|uniref:type II toxin-antitoxin system RelE/ParE family toxin n=1 Tax=Pseudorhodoferax sp. Leaf274 TaxID=1736318 RepID=UPI0009EACA26|nr:type II toxin-antitoxin system RelE/ParE family toxin [Pseudorhodoferax sp. Leaf274]
MTRVRFLPAAEIELLREVAYYSKARSGTGVRFNAAVLAAVSRIAHHPRGGAPSYLGTRSTLVKGFPFSIVYRVADGDVLVVAIAPHRMRPDYWASRVT